MYLLGLKRSEMPKYLPIKFQEVKRTSRLENKMMVERGDKSTLGDQAHDVF